MQLNLLQTKLRKMLGNPSTTDITDADLTDVINSAIDEIADKYRFHTTRNRATFVTSANVDKYEIPDDGYTVISVTRKADTTHTRDDKLNRRDANWFQRHATSVYTGVPENYTRYSDYIQLLPIPDGIYTLEVFYKQEQVKLSAPGDVPNLPLAWDRGILYKARYLFWDDNGDMAKASYANTAWLQWLVDKPQEFDDEEVMDDSVEGIRVIGLPFVGTVQTRSRQGDTGIFDITD